MHRCTLARPGYANRLTYACEHPEPPHYKVVRVEETDHDYHITAEDSNPPSVCPSCQSDAMRGHGRNEQVVRDMPTHGKRVGIYVDTRRWRCLACGKTFMESLPAVNVYREMTDRLTKWIGQQSLKRTFASIAEEVGIDEKTVRNIFRDYINELEAEFRFETPKWMGMWTPYRDACRQQNHISSIRQRRITGPT